MRSILLVVLTAVMFTACTNQSKQATEAGEKVENATIQAAGTKYIVINEESTIDWVGKKIGKEHEGNVSIASGSFTVEGEKINAGEFTIDMNSISNNDLDDDVMNAKLLGHLKSEDFFEVITYPNAKFEFTGVNSMTDEDGNTHKVTGNLTLKDMTKSISFPATIIMDGSSLTANADIVINRADWNVRYGSETHFPDLVADKVIDNNIELNISIMAKTE